MFVPFQIKCAKCKTKIKVPQEKLLGRRVACPGCKAPLTIPDSPPIDSQPSVPLNSPVEETDYDNADSEWEESGDPYGDFGDDSTLDDSTLEDPYFTERPRKRAEPRADAKERKSPPGTTPPARPRWLIPSAIASGIALLAVGYVLGSLQQPESEPVVVAADPDADSPLSPSPLSDDSRSPAHTTHSAPSSTEQTSAKPTPSSSIPTSNTPASNTPASSTASSSTASSSAPSSNTASPESTDEGDVRAALANMLKLVQADQFEQFVRYHGPIPVVNRMIQQPAASSVGSMSPSQKLAMVSFLKGLRSGNVAIKSPYTAIVSSGSLEPEVVPATNIEQPNPYAGNPATTAGYGSDLKQAITAGIADLHAGTAEPFLLKMLPPATTDMMKKSGRWAYSVDLMAPDSAHHRSMLSELQALSELEPEITENTASFELPRNVFVPGRRPQSNFKDGVRTIRFSLVDGHWRFFDNTTEHRAAVSAAFSRDIPEMKIEAKQKTPGGLTQLVKVGSDWRLTTMPRP